MTLFPEKLQPGPKPLEPFQVEIIGKQNWVSIHGSIAVKGKGNRFPIAALQSGMKPPLQIWPAERLKLPDSIFIAG